MPAKLKPCPFYHDKQYELVEDYCPVSDKYFIRCGCGVTAAYSKTPEGAVNNWNKRAGQGEEKILLSLTQGKTPPSATPCGEICPRCKSELKYNGSYNFCSKCGCVPILTGKLLLP
jgi:hypothetical protein